MDEVEVDIVQPQLGEGSIDWSSLSGTSAESPVVVGWGAGGEQARPRASLIQRGQRLVVAVVAAVLGHDVDLLARPAGVLDRGPHILLVVVPARRVQQVVALRERGVARLAALASGLGFPGAQPEQRHREPIAQLDGGGEVELVGGELARGGRGGGHGLDGAGDVLEPLHN